LPQAVDHIEDVLDDPQHHVEECPLGDAVTRQPCIQQLAGAEFRVRFTLKK
jgi:hypothetical protein